MNTIKIQTGSFEKKKKRKEKREEEILISVLIFFTKQRCRGKLI
jgi:hypothetical protein